MSYLLPRLVDDALIVSNSGSVENALALDQWSKCPRRFLYHSLLDRVSAHERVALNFGSTVHSALEHRYETIGGAEPTDAVTTRMIEVAHEKLREYRMPFGDYRSNPDYISQLLRRYNANYGEEPFTIDTFDGLNLVERGFMEHLGSISHRHPDLPNPLRVFWSGRIDLIVRWADGSVSPLDHKTSKMGGEFYFTEYKNSQPQIGYCWAVQRQLKKPVTSFVINALFCREPKRNGEINFEFDRKRIHLSTDRITEWEQNTLQIVESIIEADRRNSYPMHMSSCVEKFGACPYLDVVCSSVPDQRIGILNSQSFTSKETFRA